MTEIKWMTVDQVAEYAQLSKEAVYKHAQRGSMPAHKALSLWRFDRDEIDQWIKSKSKGEIK